MQVYQQRITEAGGVDTLLTAMHRFVEFSMVQLSVILCLIPLALGALAWPPEMPPLLLLDQGRPVSSCGQPNGLLLSCMSPSITLHILPLAQDKSGTWCAGNPTMQARLARDALDGVLRALRLHADSPDVAAKALVLVGMLAQVLQPRLCCHWELSSAYS